MKLKLFKNEKIDEQQEKHDAYTSDGYTLVKQEQGDDGFIIREYNKQ